MVDSTVLLCFTV